MEQPERPIFIFGCPRSGTTLVRVMLDGHPRIAASRETEIAISLLSGKRSGAERLTLDHVLAEGTIQRWRLNPEAVRADVDRAAPANESELLRAVFASYAGAQRKPRWANKMPTYVYHVRRLSDLFPDAQLIHVIRDGRSVAASLVERSWGPRSIVRAALQWRRAVGKGRRDGGRLSPDRYLELRLEDLVGDPEAGLRRLCRFLGEEYVPEMLDYPGRVKASPLVRAKDHQHLSAAPTEGLRNWRVGVSLRDQHAVEAVCRRLLVELGYEPGPTSVAGVVAACREAAEAAFVQSAHRLASAFGGSKQDEPSAKRGGTAAP